MIFWLVVLSFVISLGLAIYVEKRFGDYSLLYDCRKCLSMIDDILEGITGQSGKSPFYYIPRGSKVG